MYLDAFRKCFIQIYFHFFLKSDKYLISLQYFWSINIEDNRSVPKKGVDGQKPLWHDAHMANEPGDTFTSGPWNRLYSTFMNVLAAERILAILRAMIGNVKSA